MFSSSTCPNVGTCGSIQVTDIPSLIACLDCKAEFDVDTLIDAIYNPPPPTTTLTKMVPIKWCIVDDGMAPHGAPNARFSGLTRLLAVLGKSLIWSQCGILWTQQGNPVMIPDPNPPPAGPGAPGDIEAVPGVASPEMGMARTMCDGKIGHDAKEKIVDVVARRFVNAAGMPSGLLGRTSHAGECKMQRLGKVVVQDPDAFTAFFHLPLPDIPPRDSFVRTLAHEDGHALSLLHPPGMPAGHLMTQTGNTRGLTLTRAECSQARREADKKLSGVKPKDALGNVVAEKKPRSREKTDVIGDVAADWIDLTEVTAVRRADGDLDLQLDLAGLVDSTADGASYVLTVDVDANPNTGGVPSVGFSHSFGGAELLAVLSVASGRVVTLTVSTFQGGTFVPVDDPHIRGDLVTVMESDDTDIEGVDFSFPSHDSVSITVPADLLPVALVEGLRVAAFAHDPSANGGVPDEAGILLGSITDFPEPTLITLSPVAAPEGSTVFVSGVGFTPFSSVDIYLGTRWMTSTATDGSGAFPTTSFTVSAPADDVYITAEDGRTVGPVTAVDGSFLSDAMLFTLTGPPLCGNGVLDPGEICDPTASAPGNECTNGRIGTSLRTCNADCTCSCPTRVEFVGDGNYADLDTGWTGVSHDFPVVNGGVLTFGIDCGPGATRPCGQCTVTGVVENDTSVPSPDGSPNKANNHRCVNDTSIICSSDADCSGVGGACGFFFGAPLPLSSGGVPVCVVNKINGPMTGTVDIEGCAGTTTLPLLSSVFTGILNDQPCPACEGDVTPNDGVRDGTCSSDASSCDANGTSLFPSFGPTSFDCPPAAGAKNGDLDIILAGDTATQTKNITSASPNCTASGKTGFKCMCDTCAGGSNSGGPCFTDADCAGGTCGGKRCQGGANNGMACTTTSDCPGGFCGVPGQPTQVNACAGGETDCAQVSQASPPNSTDEGQCQSGPFDQNCQIEIFRSCVQDSDCRLPGDACGKLRECFTTDGTTTGDTDVVAFGKADAPPVNDLCAPTSGAFFCIGPTTSSSVNSTAGLPGLGRLILPGHAGGLP